jgi:hypothetical protein
MFMDIACRLAPTYKRWAFSVFVDFLYWLRTSSCTWSFSL